MEDWREIAAFYNYSISDEGRVRNEDSGRIMALMVNQRGIVNVGLTLYKKQHKLSVACLVARAFVPVPQEAFDSPINLDGNRLHNHAHNLTWRPRWFAVRYFQQFHPYIYPGFPTPIKDLKTGEVFSDSFEAATAYGLLDSEIVVATLNRTYVWPTYQRFQVI